MAVVCGRAPVPKVEEEFGDGQRFGLVGGRAAVREPPGHEGVVCGHDGGRGFFSRIGPVSEVVVVAGEGDNALLGRACVGGGKGGTVAGGMGTPEKR